IRLLPILQRVAALHAMLKDGVPCGNRPPPPLRFREPWLFKISVLVGVHVRMEIGRVFKERFPEVRNLRKFLLKRLAPVFRELSMLLSRSQYAQVAVVAAAFPSNKGVWQLRFPAPVFKPARAGPVQVKIPEQAVGYIESHKQRDRYRSRHPP